MKFHSKCNAVLILALVIAACEQPLHPRVATMFVSEGSYQELRNGAVPTLYEFYMKSEKDKGFYEVISKSKGDFILNYCPSAQLLTVCGDPGSGWSGQFIGVDEAFLQRIASNKITIDELGDPSLLKVRDSLFVRNSTIAPVITNGRPNL